MTSADAGMPPARSSAPDVALVAAVAVALALALSAFGVWTATSPWSFPRFLVVLLLFVYLPGKAILLRTRVAVDPIEDLSLSLLLGMVVCSALYWILGLVGLGKLLWLLPAAALTMVLPSWRRLPLLGTADGGPGPDRSRLLLVGLAVLACAPMAFHPLYYRNLDWLPSGEMTYYSLPDVVLHLGFANAILTSIPPETPFLPGRPLAYHYGGDLLVAMLADMGGLDTRDLVVRFVPTFLMIATVLAAFCLARAWLASGGMAILTALLLVLGEELSWVPGLLRDAERPWALHFSGAPSVVPLYDLNPMLPALGLLCGGLLCLLRFGREGGRVWLMLSALLLASLLGYKAFCAAQVFLALGLAAVVFLVIHREIWVLKAAVATAVLASPLAVDMYLGASARAAVQLQAWPYVPASLFRAGLWDTWLGRQTDALWSGQGAGPMAFVAFFGLAVPLYLATAAGLRLLGLPAMLMALLRPARGDAVRFLVAVFVLSGPLLTLVLAITPAGYPPELHYNNAVWFFVQSKYLAWLFAAEGLLALGRRLAPRMQALGVAVVLALSLPSTLQTFRYVSRPEPNRLGPEELGLLDFFRERTAPGAVALARTEIAEALVSFTRARAPVLTIFAYSFLSRGELQEEDRRLRDFWSSWREGRLRGEALASSRASYLVIDKARDGLGPGAAAARGGGVALEPRYDNARYTVFAVGGGGAGRVSP